MIFSRLVRTLCFIAVLLAFQPCPESHARTAPQPLASLQSYTGIWNMPTARVIPDWSMRFKFGSSEPYRYYGGAVGLFDCLEVHGQFTEVTTFDAFEGEGYGNYKDRSGGARLVLWPESDVMPQVAAGLFDATGTAYFGSRYLVFSKMFGDFDFTLGLGQGILAGEDVSGSTDAVIGEGGNAAYDFLLSSPLRKTRPFGGVEWHATPDLTLSAEYDTTDYDKMIGFTRGSPGTRVQNDDSRTPINVGLKYKLTNNILAQAAYLRGRELSCGIGVDFPLDPDGLLGWKKAPPYRIKEKRRLDALYANNTELARIICDEFYRDGFGLVEASVSDNALWVSASDGTYLSRARAFGRMASILNRIAPPRITSYFLNLREYGQIRNSLKTSRETLTAYLESRLDREGFLTFSELDTYGSTHKQDFFNDPTASEIQKSRQGWYSLSVVPKVRTFLNNRSGFFKHKVVLQTRGTIYPWENGKFTGELEHTLYNDYKDLAFTPLEAEDSVRTDMVEYERSSAPRVSMLAFDQKFELPGDVFARAAIGIFESGYAGIGAECFRYFNDGLWGVGLESEWVRKRSIDDNFAFMEDSDTVFKTGFVNIYAQILPSLGINGGLKIGRFLAGDMGASIELRRSFKYFTLGAWYTRTNTDIFTSPKNRGAAQKGVFISIPFGLFKNHETKGHFEYAITSFTRDQGQTVRQPSGLYPLTPWGTTDDLRRNLDEMRE